MYDLIGLLDSILGTHQKHANGEYYWSCPFCHHHTPKLAININKGAWHCWVCNASGRKLYSLLRKLECSKEQFIELAKILNDEFRYIPTDSTQPILSLPKEYVPLWEPSNRIDYRHALKYITERGITASDILRYQIGYCPDGMYKNRIIVPSFDADGKINYFVGRMFYDGDAMKYKNPPISKNIIGFDFHINWSCPIVLCEGVYDAMAIKRNAIPLLGKTVPSKLAEKIQLQNVSDIYVALDSDALRATAYIAEQFIKDGRNVHLVKLDGKDPSELGFDHMIDLIKGAKLMTFIDIINLRVNA